MRTIYNDYGIQIMDTFKIYDNKTLKRVFSGLTYLSCHILAITKNIKAE